ncbi:cornifelin homolog B [Syngnathoides biaculeatus]|uniref:cornifelin homolog B n=1 Tax=Syngnathoides biaculeatus TaxID=300417 RepID=UPI002ADE3CE1|nr:cornifelin homolog B [Syngnathoides biaculeatus]
MHLMSTVCNKSMSSRPSRTGSMFQEKEGGGGMHSRSNTVPYSSAVALTQPGLGVTTTTVTTITQTGGDWSSGLFDICADEGTCVVGAVAPCCLDLSVAHQYGECLCLPLLPGSSFAMRVALRERYKIRGNICNDWSTVCCCYSLAVCQMAREMKRRTMTRSYLVSTALQCS